MPYIYSSHLVIDSEALDTMTRSHKNNDILSSHDSSYSFPFITLADCSISPRQGLGTANAAVTSFPEIQISKLGTKRVIGTWCERDSVKTGFPL